MDTISKIIQKIKFLAEQAISKIKNIYANLSDAKRIILSNSVIVLIIALLIIPAIISNNNNSHNPADTSVNIGSNITDNGNHNEPTDTSTDSADTIIPEIEQPEMPEESYDNEYETEIELSSEFDVIFDSGYDSDGNYYEMVANQEETYNGVSIEIGFIKNNKWIIEPTSDWPFIDRESGLIYGFDIYDTDFIYIGNGCFAWNLSHSEIVNSNTGKYISLEDCPILNLYYDFSGNSSYHIANDGYLLLRSGKLFNTNTMSYESMKFPHAPNSDYRFSGTDSFGYMNEIFNRAKIFPYSEGLYAVVGCDLRNYTSYNDGFYNKKGERVIDLSSYNLLSTTFSGEVSPSIESIQALVFQNGYATFNVANNAGSVFQITIDKTGEVVKSVDLGYTVTVYNF